MRVLHVTETYASGVASAIDRYVASTPELEHHLLWSAGRAGSASGSPAVTFASSEQLPDGLADRLRAVRRTVKDLQPDVVHAHSTYAGVYVRTAVRHTSRRRIVYTPHCYAFERLDLSTAARWACRAVEAALALNTGTVAACSSGEAESALALFPPTPVVVVPQLVPSEPRGHPRRTPRTATGSVTVVGAGRLGAQKDPRLFLRVIQAVRASGVEVIGTWVGDGDLEMRRDLVSAGVEVTGWLPRDRVPSVMAQHQVYLHTSAWEGFPVTLVEAHAAGCVPLLRRTASQGRVTFPLQFDDATQGAAAIVRLSREGNLSPHLAAWAAHLAPHTEEAQTEALKAAYGVAEASVTPSPTAGTA